MQVSKARIQMEYLAVMHFWSEKNTETECDLKFCWNATHSFVLNGVLAVVLQQQLDLEKQGESKHAPIFEAPRKKLDGQLLVGGAWHKEMSLFHSQT